MNVEIKGETMKRIVVNTIKFTEFWTFYRLISILNNSQDLSKITSRTKNAE